jgi:alpha-glucoside transport system substrate-binding protein
MQLKKVTSIVAVAAVATIGASACSSSKKKAATTPGASNTTAATGATAAGCSAFSAYMGQKGKTVNILAGTTGPQGQAYQNSFKQFSSCTGIKVVYQADKNLEADIKTKVQGGSAPDLTVLAQPGLVAELVGTGKVAVAPAKVLAESKAGWAPSIYNYGYVGGKFYGPPLDASVKSLVWYSPTTFKKNSWAVPTTWKDMIALSDKIAASSSKTGTKPWCVGISSAAATGWPLTDWMEEVVLRMYGPTVYAQWVKGTVKFTDPRIAKAMATVGSIVKNPNYVNAGIGNVKSIATTPFASAGLPIEPKKGAKCAMMQMASFYGSDFDKGTKIGPTGDIYAFYEPSMDSTHPVEIAGDVVIGFNSKPATQLVQEFIASPDWVKANVAAQNAVGGGWISGNKLTGASIYTNAIDKLSYAQVINPKTVAAFDGSDAMPAVVGSGSFWTQMTKWILGQSDSTTLANIESTFPK